MDTSTLITILTAVGGVLGGVLGAPLVGKIFDRFASAGERRGDELAEIRRDQGAALRAKESECETLRKQVDTWQERYYKAHEEALLAKRDVEYYQRLTRISASVAERAELVARETLDVLPVPTIEAGGG